MASPQGSPQAIFGDRTLVSEEGVSLLCSVTPVSGLWKQTDFGDSSPWSVSSPIVEVCETPPQSHRVMTRVAQGWWEHWLTHHLH